LVRQSATNPNFAGNLAYDSSEVPEDVVSTKAMQTIPQPDLQDELDRRLVKSRNQEIEALEQKLSNLSQKHAP
jgi:hypothetical protein